MFDIIVCSVLNNWQCFLLYTKSEGNKSTAELSTSTVKKMADIERWLSKGEAEVLDNKSGKSDI